MANVKITQLPLATTPLTGTEDIPLVQGTTTKQVTVTGLFTSPVMTNPTLGTVGQADLINATGLPISTGVAGLGTGVATFLGTPSSANLRAAVTDETGTGSLVFATSPTLVTPNLGTPTAMVATNITGTALGLIAGSAVTNANLTGAVTSVGNATSLGSFTSAQLVTALTDETGSGSAVFATSPTLVTPALGTPSALVGTNITGTASGLTAGNVTTNANLTGAVTSVGNATSLGSFTSSQLATALSDETGSGSAVFATSPTLVTPILGTPTSATLTNATGLPIATGVSGLGTGVATFLATPSSANLRSALTDETGTGSAVFATSPTLVTPALGTPSSAVLTNATGLPNAGLVNSSITIGGTAIALGASSNALANDITIQGVTVGRGAGAVATNTAVGASAISNASAGLASTALGYFALTSATGNYNTGVGSQTLYNTTGSDNVGVGNNALITNTSGSYNTAIGRSALQANTTASNNTAVGYQAGYLNQTGTTNVFIGKGAGYTNNSGNNNVYIGAGKVGFQDPAGFVATGSNNTFVGGAAGATVLTGSANTIIGQYNGNQGGLDITNASNYIVLSDGDGNPRGYFDGSGNYVVGGVISGGTTTSGTFHRLYTNNSNDWSLAVHNTSASPYGLTINYPNASPNGNVNQFWNCADSTASRGYLQSNGGLANYSSNNTNLSDRREKTNFAPAGSYLDKICAIPVQTFNYIDQNLEEDGGLTLGVVAQDVQAVAPELVTESNWGTKEEPKMRLSIYQTDLQYALMKCIQEQQAIIESLKARLDAANL